MAATTLWIEKYRPQNFSDVRGQEAIIEKVRSFVEKKNMPHLLFVGPAGVGKSSLALVVGRQLFGDQLRENFLELNASDERGIDVVRVKIKDFARTRSMGSHPFKIIFLDECDALTKEAQQALRRTMESYSATTRFILSANYSSKIIDPIQSRCCVFKFKPLSKNDIQLIMETIKNAENISFGDGVVDALYEVSQGDCRRAENILQTSAASHSHITKEIVFDLASVAEPKEILEVMSLALTGEFIRARDTLITVMLKYGLAGIDVIKQMQKEVWNLKCDDRKKVELVTWCGEIEFRMVEGSDEYVQLETLLARCAAVGAEKQ